MANGYGRRGVAGGAHGGGTRYGTFQPMAATAFLSPEERSQFMGAASTLERGGLTSKQRRKAEKKLSKGQVSKSFRQLQKGFGAMAGAGQRIGALREQAGERALGQYQQEAMQYSKPWQYQAAEGLLQPTEVTPFDYSQWAGERITTKKLRRRLQSSYQPGMGGVRGQLGELVRGRGFGEDLTFNAGGFGGY